MNSINENVAFTDMCTCIYTHGSYNLEKVLNFSSRLEKSLISLLGLEKSLKFSNLFMPYHFSEKLNDFAGKFCALTTNNWR